MVEKIGETGRRVTDPVGTPGKPDQAVSAAPVAASPVGPPAGRPENGNGPALLDEAVLARLEKSLGPKADTLLPSFLSTFGKDGPALLATARRGLADGHAEEVQRAGHTLKSNAATFGAMALSAVCLELERAGKTGDLAGATGLLSRAEEEWARAWEKLQARLGR